MWHSLSKDTTFNRETAPRHTFLCIPPWRSHNPVRITKSPITGKSFIRGHRKQAPDQTEERSVNGPPIFVSKRSVQFAIVSMQNDSLWLLLALEDVEVIGDR